MLALLVPLYALAADPRAELLSAYGPDQTSADHVWVVQTGGAVSPDALRGMLIEAVAALPAGDRLSVVTYAETPTDALPPTPLPEGDRAALQAQVAALALPPSPWADLGAALDHVSRALSTRPASPHTFVVLLSDFCNAAPPTSTFAFEGTTGCRQVRGVPAMALAMEQLRTDRRVFPITVDLAKPDPEGRRAVERVLGKGSSVSAVTGRADWVSRMAESLVWRKLSSLVGLEVRDLALQAQVTSVEGERVRVRLTTGLTHLGLELSSVTWKGELPLKPEKGAVRLMPDGDLDLIVQPPEPPFSLIPAQRTLPIQGELRATATLEPRAALDRLDTAPGRGVQRLPLTATYTQIYGPSPALFWTSVAALLGLAGWVARRLRRRA